MSQRKRAVIAALYTDEQGYQQVLFAAPSHEEYDQIAKALGYKPEGDGYYFNAKEGRRIVPDNRVLIV